METCNKYITLTEAVDEVMKSYKTLDREIVSNFLALSIDIGVLSCFFYDNECFFYKNDFYLKMEYIILNCSTDKSKYWDMCERENFFQELVLISNTTFVVLETSHLSFVDYAILQNLVLLSIMNCAVQGKETKRYVFPKDITEITVQLYTNSGDVVNYISAQYRAIELTMNNKSSFFANSAHYMGSKKNLANFLISCIGFHNKEDAAILDIMCGSGAASNAFCHLWKTYASDALEFPKILATIQGKCRLQSSSDNILEKLMPAYYRNFEELNKLYSNVVNQEYELFREDFNTMVYVSNQERETLQGIAKENKNLVRAEGNKELQEKYQRFINNTPLYYSGKSMLTQAEIMIDSYVNERKNNSTLFPYCLFSTYYANIYFGVLQTMQIDSLRYAIDQLEDTTEKLWALGALIITCSVSGTTYGGHFAQPVKVTDKNIDKIIMIRKRSILREFSKRLQAITDEGQLIPNIVDSVDGPWENSLIQMSKKPEKLIVYLDAPYKREEYSRYYHIFETLVKYNYPNSEGIGRLSSKQEGERFSSEFFTHSQEKVNSIFISIISSILEHGWKCVWSYSDNGTASLMEVINQVSLKTSCDIFIYNVPYRHKVHGKTSRQNANKSVIEYLIVFSNKIK